MFLFVRLCFVLIEYMLKSNRRGFLKIAAAGAAASVITIPSLAATSAQATTDEFLSCSELLEQRDSLIDSIIRKNPRHLELSESEIAQLKEEGRHTLDILFKQLAENQFSAADLGEIVEHLSKPAEKKWAKFHKLAVQEARASFVDRVETAISRKKT